jgi:tetratricopeptide (TPR) repeat protein
MSKCFVSFSSRDGEFAGKLLASFRLQEIDVWDYSNPAEDTPLGVGLKSDLCRRIDASDHFIAVITPSSTHPESGKFCIFEMQYAHSREKRILPLAFTECLPFDAGPELPFLQDAKYLSFDPSDSDAYEKSFKRLCEEIGAKYVPPFLGDPRVIFAPRFEKEIRGLGITRQHGVDLRLVIDEFTRNYREEKWDKALAAIVFFIGGCERWLKGIAMYYPTVLLALCQMHRDRLEEAEKTLESLLNHPLADENLWAALGQIDFMRGDFERALAKFKIARDKCPEGKDWEARFNILAASAALRKADEAWDLFSRPELADRPLDDQVKVANLQAALFSRKGDWRSVIVVLHDIFERKIGDPASAIYLSEAYERRGDASNAMDVLASEAQRLKNTNLYHRLATLYVRLGDPVSALDVYESKLLGVDKRQRQMLTDYALILRSIGQHAQADSACRRALDLGRPENDAESYFRGLAFFLLGRQAEAKMAYEDSKNHGQYYDRFVHAGR